MAFRNYLADLTVVYIYIMRFKIVVFILFLIVSGSVNAQLEETFSHRGEYGFSVGTGHYLGDLNPNASIGHPKFAAGIFYLRQLNNYVGIKVNADYTFLGYSDSYSDNIVQKIRNLSFNTDVYELSVTGNFNFFKFFPLIPQYRFTPYLSAGLGAIYFNPYTYLGGQRYDLNPLKTEGQASPYSLVSWVVPIGFGVKYNVTDRINIFSELTYRFTGTGYLDDVNGTYAGAASFDAGSIAYQLQDRSNVYTIPNITTPIGIKGRQRGNGRNDSYATFQVGISFNLQEGYNCPAYSTY